MLSHLKIRHCHHTSWHRIVPQGRDGNCPLFVYLMTCHRSGTMSIWLRKGCKKRWKSMVFCQFSHKYCDVLKFVTSKAKIEECGRGGAYCVPGLRRDYNIMHQQPEGEASPLSIHGSGEEEEDMILLLLHHKREVDSKRAEGGKLVERDSILIGRGAWGSWGAAVVTCRARSQPAVHHFL